MHEDIRDDGINGDKNGLIERPGSDDGPRQAVADDLERGVEQNRADDLAGGDSAGQPFEGGLLPVGEEEAGDMPSTMPVRVNRGL